MDLESFSALDEGITKEDWERTPESIRRLVRFLIEEVDRRLAELEEDKILSKIEKVKSSKTGEDNHIADSEEEKILHCSFCRRSSEEVAKIVSGHAVSICNECIEICNEILADLGVEGRDGSDRTTS